MYSGFFDGGSVWLDHDASHFSERWKMVTVPAPDVNHFQFFVSADGHSWRRVGNESGPSGDRATMFKNRFRNKFVFSLKELWPGFGDAVERVGRARNYVESDVFVTDGENWSGTAGSFPWVGSDLADPVWPYNPKIPAELCECHSPFAISRGVHRCSELYLDLSCSTASPFPTVSHAALNLSQTHWT